MKYLILVAMIMTSSFSFAQKYFTKTGKTEFKASVEAFEPVEATNNSTTAILNVATGDVASLLFVKSFKFEIALMEEHFNENYMDSDVHPKATFKGKLGDFDVSKLSDTFQSFPLSGVLTVKGKNKNVTTTAQLKMVEGKIYVESHFSVKPEEFDIEIPGVVKEKIAKSINIDLHYELIKKG